MLARHWRRARRQHTAEQPMGSLNAYRQLSETGLSGGTIMATRPDFEARDIPTFPRPSAADQRLVAVWKEVSIIVHRLRLSDVPTASNAMLREYIRQEKSRVLSPLFQLWIGDNFLFAGRLPEAIKAYL